MLGEGWKDGSEAMVLGKSQRFLFVPGILMLAIGLVLGACASGDSQETLAPAGTSNAPLHDVAVRVAELRGLDLNKEAAPQFVNTAELRSLLEQRFQEDYPREEAQTYQEVLLLLDLLKPGDDLYSILLDLLTEQVVGLYDSETKELYLRGEVGEIAAQELLTYAHEYTHALQDQHFDLESLPTDVEDNADLSTAAVALIEGDAVLTEALYMMGELSRAEIEGLVVGANSPRLDAAPPIVRESLLFPYVQGLDFVSALFLAGGWRAVDQAFTDLPQSTEQILHPEKYLGKRDHPTLITLPDLQKTLGEKWTQQDTDVLGELSIRLYLDTFLTSSQAIEAAEGWGGDRHLFFKDHLGGPLLVLLSTWDTAADAQEFFRAYQSFVEIKSDGSWKVVRQGESVRWWTTPGLSTYLALLERDVLIVLAPEEAVVPVVVAQFSGF